MPETSSTNVSLLDDSKLHGKNLCHHKVHSSTCGRKFYFAFMLQNHYSQQVLRFLWSSIERCLVFCKRSYCFTHPFIYWCNCVACSILGTIYFMTMNGIPWVLLSSVSHLFLPLSQNHEQIWEMIFSKEIEHLGNLSLILWWHH